MTLLDIQASVKDRTMQVLPEQGIRASDGDKAFLEYFDSKGRSFQRITSDFEVVTEQKYGESLQVVTFRIKR